MKHFATMCAARCAWLFLFAVTTVQATQAQDPDLPGRVANVETILSGALIIPNAYDGSGTLTCTTDDYQTGGVKVYGAVVHLLHDDIPVKWAVLTGKAKDAVDFEASVASYDVSDGTTGSTETLAFCAGAWIVPSGFAVFAQTTLNAYGNNIEVYQLQSNTDIDILYTLTHKPVAGVLQNGNHVNIHKDHLANGGLDECSDGTAPGEPNCHYLDGLDENGLASSEDEDELLAQNVTSETCVTVLTEPHADVDEAAVDGIISFLNEGGNFTAQCEAVFEYEAEAVTANGTGLLTSTGLGSEDETAPAYDYPNPDLAYSQFLGDLPNEGGSWGGGPIADAFINSGYSAAQKGASPTDGSLPLEAFAGKLSTVATANGGNVFYMGGHDWESDNAGERLYLNTILVPATRPTACGLIALPVEVTNFSARVEASDVVLAWNTETETNNSGFEVEHEVEASFQALDFVEGAGSTLTPQAYTYRVEALEPGKHRFRLKQIDFDGTFEYSPVVEVLVETPDRYHLSSMYPNPFNPQTSFTLSVATDQRVQIDVFDVMGRQVLQLHNGMLSAHDAHRFTFNAEGMPNGLYLIRVSGTTFRANRTVTLLK